MSVPIVQSVYVDGEDITSMICLDQIQQKDSGDVVDAVARMAEALENLEEPVFITVYGCMERHC